jgi:hypothetical protein
MDLGGRERNTWAERCVIANLGKKTLCWKHQLQSDGLLPLNDDNGLQQFRLQSESIALIEAIPIHRDTALIIKATLTRLAGRLESQAALGRLP